MTPARRLVVPLTGTKSKNTKVVPDLLRSWDSVAAQIRKRGRVTIFLDFDGTLVDIAPRPELVHLKPEAQRSFAAIGETSAGDACCGERAAAGGIA